MNAERNLLKEPRKLRCGAVWGGIEPVRLDAHTKGVRASLYSNASGGERGGDIYYVSICSNDLRTRMVVADVQGHGEQVSEISNWLYQNLQAKIDSTDCAAALSDLNKLVHRRGSTAITTAAVLSHDISESALYYSYAGHPPVLARESERRWLPLDLKVQVGRANLPLGVFRSVRYDQAQIRVKSGDRFLLYTDGLTEAMRPESEEEFGEKELSTLLEAHGAAELSDLRDTLVQGATVFSGGHLSDDCTVMIVEIR